MKSHMLTIFSCFFTLFLAPLTYAQAHLVPEEMGYYLAKKWLKNEHQKGMDKLLVYEDKMNELSDKEGLSLLKDRVRKEDLILNLNENKEFCVCYKKAASTYISAHPSNLSQLLTYSGLGMFSTSFIYDIVAYHNQELDACAFSSLTVFLLNYVFLDLGSKLWRWGQRSQAMDAQILVDSLESGKEEWVNISLDWAKYYIEELSSTLNPIYQHKNVQGLIEKRNKYQTLFDRKKYWLIEELEEMI